jgi:uncharacterized protein
MKLQLNSYSNLQDSIDSLAFLKVTSIGEFGAFLATGTEKDILLPHAEQNDELRVGDDVIVFIYLDNNQRPCSSMKIEKFLKKNVITPLLEVNQQVELIIYDETDLGFKTVVDKKYLGLLYKNEVFEKLYYADMTVGFVKKVRTDGKIDLILRAPGHQATDDIAIKLLEQLKINNNFLNITDKTSPEIIYEKFQTSKKKFKIALGRLYKERVILVADDGIRLNPKAEHEKK